MPSPKKPCPHPGCDRLIEKVSSFCKRHCPRTEEHVRKQAETQIGKKISESQRRRISDAQRQIAIRNGNASFDRPCEWCDILIRVKPCQAKNNEGRFCSSACAYRARCGNLSPNWRGGKVTIVCPQCSSSFQRTPGALKGHKNHFCSLSCRSIYNKARQRNSCTDIEVMMEEALISEKIAYIPQYPVTRVSVLDFYLPDASIALFCDGDYWHRLPKHIKTDLRQNDMLSVAGYRVLRFWGEEIKDDMPSCIKAVKKAIKKGKLESQQLSLWG